jgi:protein-S-isoprenylcysteine O-methyltransferase Ste14
LNQTISPYWGYGLMLAGTICVGLLRLPFSQQNRSVAVKERRGGGTDALLLWLIATSVVVLPSVAAGGLLRFADQPMAPWRAIAGLPLFAVALTLFYRTHADLGTNFSYSVVVKDSHALVTNGIYARVRHPMYSSFLLMGMAQLLLVPSWVAGPAGLLATLFFLPFRVGREERMMQDTFGEAYADYARRTNRFWP